MHENARARPGELLTQAKGGDHRASSILEKELTEAVLGTVVKHQRHTWGFVDRDEARDIVQEAWKTVWKQVSEQGRSIRNLRTWTTGVALHICQSRERKYVKRKQALKELKAQTLRQAKGATGAARELAVHFHAELLGFLECYREEHPHRYDVFYNHVILRYSFTEVADVLGMPIGTVKRYYHDAKVAVTEALAVWANAPI